MYYRDTRRHLDFCSSGVFAAHMMATLFCWHTQHKSVMGFMTMSTSSQIVLYAAALKEASSQASLYSTHTAYMEQGIHTFMVVCEGSNFDVIPFVAWDSARKKDGIVLSKILQEIHYAPRIIHREWIECKSPVIPVVSLVAM